MGRFDDIDLGGDAALKRMVKTIARQRTEIIFELEDILRKAGHVEAARILMHKAQDELKEAGLCD